MTRDRSYASSWFGPETPAFNRRRARRLPIRHARRRVIVPRASVEALRERSWSGPRPHSPKTQGEVVVTPEQRLVQRATMGATQNDLAQVAALGYGNWLAEQLDPEGIPDNGLEDLLVEALPSLELSSSEILGRYSSDPGTPIFQLVTARLYRAVYSPRQLHERMVTFWSDHFHTDLFSDVQFALKPVDQRRVIRPHALGKFRDLLHASAKSPSMLTYLTNDSNVKGHPNENYARELMELHTLGADNGYTQRDVVEVARCLTGWTVDGRPGPGLGTFVFAADEHDTGEKVVLGQVIPAGGGVEDGERVLDILAGSPRTAKFIAGKLAHYLWGYNAPPSVVNRAAAVFRNTGGDIKEVVRALLKRSRLKGARPKLKRPFHLVTSAARALAADIRGPFTLLTRLLEAGHLPYYWHPPNGYPDSEGYWSGFVLPRFNFGANLFSDLAGGMVLGVDFVDPDLSVDQIVDRIGTELLHGGLTESTQQALTDFLAAAPLGKRRIREAIGLAVSSPEFQSY